MEGAIDICVRSMNEIYEILRDILKEVDGENLARAERENINGIEINYKNFTSRIKRTGPVDSEAAVQSAKGVAIHAQSLGMSISKKSNYPVNVVELAEKLEHTATKLSRRIDNDPEFSLPYQLTIGRIDDSLTENGMNIRSAEKTIIEMEAKLRSDVDNFQRAITKGYDSIDELKKKSTDESVKLSENISNLIRELEPLRISINDIKKNVANEISKAAEISSEAAKRTSEIDTQINDLLGQNASKVLLIDYANTAEKEGKSADTMRYLSLACMVASGVIVCIALYQTLSGEFDWRLLLLKAFAAIALSVPAAYLARESSRHRAQEHSNRRISMDLKAMTPYLASLPSEEQNKIKSEVASRVFGMQLNGAGDSSDYPINIQELVKLIIEKIPSK
ncbi:hypothetical protein OH708_17330 [Pseudomonas capsici]|uniref:hypothetical protein n=1 Tax=Pseudomonas capsici TaxID=2810614 RepID=UPI0021F1E0DA|nr:hypothetical protein [Pseudomonas capsici]MCV4289684.1 hypothetical protein [Pseudomonas capsici]